MIDLQNTILEMIAKGESLADTINRLCLEVERIVPDAICSVLRVDSQGCLHSLAAPSLPAEYSALIDGLPIGPNVGSCGTAAWLGEEVAVQDVETDPRWHDYKHLVLPLGLKACWSSPVFGAHDRPIATFAFYYREKRGPLPIEREMVDRCVHLCAIALDRHRRVLEHERRAYTDALTGLANRAAFNIALPDLDCTSPGTWALCLVDLDNLKVVNDTFGHQAGDILLKEVGDRLAAAAAPDKVFRIGGDEFAIVVRSSAALRDIDRTVEAYLEALVPTADCDGKIVGPRATIGLAVLSDGDRTAERVRQNADFALYHAKETRRGGYVRYWPGIGTRMTRRLTAIREVDAALREGRIEPFYQPIILFETGEIVGLEALCRMRIGNTVVPASSFHDATTDASVAAALTRQIVSQVARDVRIWLDMGIPFQHVGINVSSVDFHNGSIYSVLAENFERERVPLKHVILEVTESVYMDDDAGVVRQSMAALREKGLKIALDDFGTGYASLTHLMSVPVDIIKIDKSFVDSIVDKGPSAAIIEGIVGIVGIAGRLGIKVVAEGIEERSQVRQLMGLGCGLGQGYLYSRAVDAGEAGEMMLKFAQGLGPAKARLKGG
ncbi:bifunctional diguanylate cyclase/phosphodiesterase [Novosphingobium sp. P6W]|uniref:putative bifunctional diguanylate cyclase/phosphodiesterase n=1 Tax=Novosphingobium sp. P6W TaxID=1609758 RepID=UPI000DE82B9A|nr:EAL domain-containing protein [Novosphingobium sp. P6W]AXB79167.1 diguanylate cyclase [Novosphingobium sp. P6W]